MTKFDPNADLFPEGWHLFEVTATAPTFTQKGVEMWKVTMRDVHTGRMHSERWWAEGEWVGMTTPKLKALGLDLNNDVEPADLIGRRMYGKVKHTEGKGDYGPQAQIGSVNPESKVPKDFAEPPDRAPMPFDGGPAAVQGGDEPF